jgi:hypothetical protein
METTMFTATVHTSAPETLSGRHLRRGQWIDYDGAIGRWVGVTNGGIIWIAWGNVARKRDMFRTICAAFRENS